MDESPSKLPRCPIGCEGTATRMRSSRWGDFWRCGSCGHEWRLRSSEAADGGPTEPVSARTLRGRLGALTKWAMTEDRSAATRSARRAFMQRFERLVDPDGRLDPRERAKRAEFARRAHMTRLALLSGVARRQRAARREQQA